MSAPTKPITKALPRSPTRAVEPTETPEQTEADCWATLEREGGPWQHARWAVSNGMRVINFATRTKGPTQKDWPRRATNDPETLVRWQALHPNDNLGYTLDGSGIAVIDIDDTEAFAIFTKTHGLKMPMTAAVETRKGYHFYTTAPTGIRLAFKHAWGEVKTTGQMVGIGSIHPEGHIYRLFQDLPIAPMPPEYIPLLAEPEAQPSRVPAGHVAYGGLSTQDLEILRSINANYPHQTKGVTLCPAHDDHKPTLSWNADSERLLLKCFAGCSFNDIRIAALEPSRNVERKPNAGSSDAPIATEPDGDGILNVRDYLATIPETIPWLIEGFVFLHGVTLIAGLPKAGKSTLATEMQRSRETGQPFLGMNVTKGPALLITEESGVPVGYKVRDLATLDIYDRKASKGERFNITLLKAFRWARKNPGGIVFIDTLAVWANIEDENDASKVTTAMNRINALATHAETGVVLVHHARKGGGKDGEAVRGSGAMVASVDHIVEVKRTEGQSRTTRFVDTMSRVTTERRLLVDYDPETRRYEVVNEREREDAEIEAELEGIPSDGAGMTRREIGDLWQKDPKRRIEQLLNKGRLKVGNAKIGRTWAKVYWSIPPIYAQPHFEGDDG